MDEAFFKYSYEVSYLIISLYEQPRTVDAPVDQCLVVSIAQSSGPVEEGYSLLAKPSSFGSYIGPTQQHTGRLFNISTSHSDLW